MSKFWQKKYISKYTGREIDAAVAKADTVPAVTEADAGKVFVIDEDGKIVKGEPGVATIPYIAVPEIFDTAVNSCLQSIGAALLSDYKFHRAETEITHTDTGWDDLNMFDGNLTDTDGRAVIQSGTAGVVYLEKMVVIGNLVNFCLKNYNINSISGLTEVIILYSTGKADGYTSYLFTVYARRCEVAT